MDWMELRWEPYPAPRVPFTPEGMKKGVAAYKKNKSRELRELEDAVMKRFIERLKEDGSYKKNLRWRLVRPRTPYCVW